MGSLSISTLCRPVEDQPAPTIRFEAPETCPFLKKVLECTASGTVYEKLDVLQGLQSALPNPFEEHIGTGVGAATYLLENGLLGEVLRGLEEAANGNWVERLYLLETADYPGPCTNGTMDAFVFATGGALLSTLHTLLIWSHGVKRSLARRAVFLNCILRRVGEYFYDGRYVNEALMVVLWPAPHMLPRTLERIAPLCLAAVNHLSESESRHEIETVLVILHKLAAFNLPFLCSHFFTDREFLDCARALAACSSLSVFSKRFGEAVLWSEVQRKGGVQLNQTDYIRLMGGKTTEEERRKIRKGIMKSRPMLARSRTLSQICATEKSRLTSLLDRELGEDNGIEENSSVRSGQEPGPQEPGKARSFKLITHPLRQCSAPDCKNVEERSKEFASCSQCKLTAYCSRACQKRAWKAGHSAVCEQ
ncbi:hypothetical protein KFL_001150070 [Klebsormidium nitens]|uniref:MYND-type domain-containing protein n=1 Tax=Klebsormidium nitens TaxID=105231 RepID=A0A1Y1I1A2_KLENI|nr:hypothetical protein KFL_001150070 [Klebsormidium nitens]|eukprot:GAQ82547.1 hypothetical protein KFL_001150070 [Klebsormidium nitens]